MFVLSQFLCFLITDGVIGISIAATAVGLVAGGIAAALTRRKIPPPSQQQQYFVQQNPYQAGVIPPNAIVGDPKGIPIQQTMYRDTPAPFNYFHCGNLPLSNMYKDVGLMNSLLFSSFLTSKIELLDPEYFSNLGLEKILPSGTECQSVEVAAAISYGRLVPYA
nr:GSH-induced LITAF domain protein [Ipomoea batatas]